MGEEKPPIGKLPGYMLSRFVLRYRGRGRGDVILWPKYGEDAGAVKLGGETLVIASDPVTGSKNLVGWLAVHINANDVAVCGAKPTWMSSCILLPEGSKAEDFRNIARQIDRAARSIDVAVVTGHSEITPNASSPIVVGTMVGKLVSKKLITSSGARPGDYIVMSKTAGLEGAAILSTDLSEVLGDKGVDPATIKKASRYYSKISIVKEALQLAKTGLATAMHDPTEGGVIGGLYELCSASGCGFEVYVDKIPVSREVRLICNALGIDPLRLISSGVLLASVRKPPKSRGFKIIGRVTRRREGMRIISENGETRVKSPPVDELWRILDLYAR